MGQDKSRAVPNYLKNIKYNPQMIRNDYLAFKEEKSLQDKDFERLENFKKRLEPFKKISSYEEAKELLNKTMPIKLDRTTFYIGNAKCVIVDYENQLRICLDSPKEFISFDFVKKEQ